jgi:hypothetical protein
MEPEVHYLVNKNLPLVPTKCYYFKSLFFLSNFQRTKLFLLSVTHLLIITLQSTALIFVAHNPFALAVNLGNAISGEALRRTTI